MTRGKPRILKVRTLVAAAGKSFAAAVQEVAVAIVDLIGADLEAANFLLGAQVTPPRLLPRTVVAPPMTNLSICSPSLGNFNSF
jgi:hypothetical protein